ncbi:molecular chaperone GrpE [Scatolibacter rhodanostii]|uniref:molecular chaperone GrpE n=1 Tax=Scatolibacter rhodanostii TaxID=2014781 RepID=UPI000C06CC69|nr:molecular chaperone GrpE [Scatolibacter rhodanostii]
MNYYKQQQKEIATIKPRTITLNLSDADVNRLYGRTGKSGLTPSELLQNFVGDLVYGTYSNGSDERAYAKEWFDHCYFAHKQNETLLSYLLEIDELDSFLATLAVIDNTKEEIEDTLSDEWMTQNEIQEDVDRLTKELAEYQEEIETYFENFQCSEKGAASEIPAEYSLETEIQRIMDWKAKKDTLAF